MTKEKKEITELTPEELQTIISLLYKGKLGLSLQENNSIVVPLINKITAILKGGRGISGK